MKILVATEGTSWESPVAQKFERAVWYLVIDTATLEKDVFQNLPPNDHNNILLAASRTHVAMVVAGMVNATTARVLQSLNMRFAVVQKMSVRTLTRMAKDDALHPINLSVFRDHARIPPPPRARDEFGILTGKSEDRPARPHRHLQQYGGRGH
jgi:predicted Fe-Mo cluster-binding NifX family protein